MATAYRMTKVAAFLLEPMMRIEGELIVAIEIDMERGVIVTFDDGSQTAYEALQDVVAAVPACGC